MGVEKYFVTGLRTEICKGAGDCESWGVCVGVFILGFQVGVFKFVCFVNSWFPFFDGVSLPTTSR
jgi:hypothetical protein